MWRNMGEIDALDLDSYRAAKTFRAEQDIRLRDEWIKEMQSNKATQSIMVGQNVTLFDVHRWLSQAVAK